MKERELVIGRTYYAFYFDPSYTVCYAGLVYYAGKGMCVNYIGRDMLENTLPVHYSMLVPKEQITAEGGTLLGMKTSPGNWNIDKVAIKDMPSEHLHEYEWWNEYMKRHGLE